MEIRLDIPAKRITDILTTAIESGYSRYWCAGVYIKGEWEGRKTSTDWWYASPEVFEGDFIIDVHEITDERKGTIQKHRINAVGMAEGFVTFAAKAPFSFAAFIQSEEDGPAADNWLQCIALGEVRYG